MKKTKKEVKAWGRGKRGEKKKREGVRQEKKRRDHREGEERVRMKTRCGGEEEEE